MSEGDFIILFGTLAFLLFAGVFVLIVEWLALKLFPEKFIENTKLSEELDLLYSELAKGKEINIAKYIKEKI